jgi:cytochrome b561
LMLLMPVSGMVMSLMGGHPISVFSLFTIPALSQGGTAIGKLGGLAHTYVAYTMIAALVLHIGAALLHHFFFKDNVLRRIISGN